MVYFKEQPSPQNIGRISAAKNIKTSNNDKQQTRHQEGKGGQEGGREGGEREREKSRHVTSSTAMRLLCSRLVTRVLLSATGRKYALLYFIPYPYTFYFKALHDSITVLPLYYCTSVTKLDYSTWILNDKSPETKLQHARVSGDENVLRRMYVDKKMGGGGGIVFLFFCFSHGV